MRASQPTKAGLAEALEACGLQALAAGGSLGRMAHVLVLEAFGPDHVRPGAVYHRTLGDGHEVTVYPVVEGLRLCWGAVGDVGYARGYDYSGERSVLALEAAGKWDGSGDPLDGWERCLDGRRREDGDPTKEHIRW